MRPKRYETVMKQFETLAPFHSQKTTSGSSRAATCIPSQMDATLHVAETYIGAFTSSLTRRTTVQLDISIGEDIARLRCDPSVQAAFSIALQQDTRDLEYLKRIQALTQRAIFELESHSARRCATLAPVASCPPELLADIFCIVASAGEVDDIARGLIDITAVSKRWRDIALSTSRLWAKCSNAWCAEQQSTWLERSATGPVDVLIWGAERLSLALCSHAHRWRSLSYDGPGGSESILENMKTLMDFPDLSHLVSIRFASAHTPASAAEHRCDARNFRSKLPALESLHIPLLKIDNLEAIAGNLAEIALCNVTYTSQELHKLLKSCNSTLVVLKLAESLLSEARLDFSLELERIVIPKLKTLSIERATGPHLRHFLDIVHAPILACLASPFTPTKQWFQVHSSIESICLHSGDSSGQAACDMLEMLTASSEESVRGLTQLVPSLQSLDIRTHGKLVPFETVQKFINGRILPEGFPSEKVLNTLILWFVPYTPRQKSWIRRRVVSFEIIGGLQSCWLSGADNDVEWSDEELL